MKGFSVRNLKYMRAFAEAYPDRQFVQQLVAQIPWGHNVRLIERVKDPDERLWYIQQTIEHGWSRAVLVHQIESDLYHRHGKALTNFQRTLPEPQCDLARELLKDPYNLEFLDVAEEMTCVCPFPRVRSAASCGSSFRLPLSSHRAKLFELQVYCCIMLRYEQGCCGKEPVREGMNRCVPRRL